MALADGDNDSTARCRTLSPVERLLARLTLHQKQPASDVATIFGQVCSAMDSLRIAEELPPAGGSKTGSMSLGETEGHRVLNQAWRAVSGPQLVAHQLQGPGGDRAKPGWQAKLNLGHPSHAWKNKLLAPIQDVEDRWMKLMLGEAFLLFDLFDQTRFALYYETGTGEPTPVEVVRISPVDATRLVKETAFTPPDQRKLAGNALAHFSAFLDERWRRNDVLWGRLDGAERLITTLLPPTDADSRKVHGELVVRSIIVVTN